MHETARDLDALLRAAANADLSRAALVRSYWWTPGDDLRLPVWLGCHGLPDSGALAWLLAGQPRPQPVADEAPYEAGQDPSLAEEQ